jgi:hypothetical protein
MLFDASQKDPSPNKKKYYNDVLRFVNGSKIISTNRELPRLKVGQPHF